MHRLTSSQLAIADTAGQAWRLSMCARVVPHLSNLLRMPLALT